MSAAEARRYLAQVLRYGLGDSEVRGIREFARRLEERDLLSGMTPRELSFLEPSTLAVEGKV